MGVNKKAKSLACKNLDKLEELTVPQLHFLCRVIGYSPRLGNRPISRMRKNESIKALRRISHKGTFPDRLLKFAACKEKALGNDVPEEIWALLGKYEGGVISLKNYLWKLQQK